MIMKRTKFIAALFMLMVGSFVLTSCFKDDKGDVSDYTGGEHDSRLFGKWYYVEGEDVFSGGLRASDESYYFVLNDKGEVKIYLEGSSSPLPTARKLYYKTKGNKTIMLLNVSSEGKSAIKKKYEYDYKLYDANSILRMGPSSKYKR